MSEIGVIVGVMVVGWCLWLFGMVVSVGSGLDSEDDDEDDDATSSHSDDETVSDLDDDDRDYLRNWTKH